MLYMLSLKLYKVQLGILGASTNAAVTGYIQKE